MRFLNLYAGEPNTRKKEVLFEDLFEALERVSQLKKNQSSLKLNIVEIPKVSAKDLSYESFYKRFAIPQKPVIITDLTSSMFSTNWTLDYLSFKCGQSTVMVKNYKARVITQFYLHDAHRQLHGQILLMLVQLY